MIQRTPDVLDHTPPADLDAEIAVLGSVLLLPDCYDDVAVLIGADDFYDEANSRIFRQVATIRDAGKPLDIAILVDRLKQAGDFESVGGAAYLYRVSQAVPNAAHARYYAGIVRKHSLRRQVLEAATGIVRDAYDDTIEVGTLIETAENSLVRVSERNVPEGRQNDEGDVHTLLQEALVRLDERMRGETEQLRCGICAIDRIVAFRKKQLVVVGARPSQGKTALLLLMAKNFSLRQPALNVLFITLEMGELELTERLLSLDSGLDTWKLGRGRLSTDERKTIVESAGHLAEAKLWVRDPGGISASQIASLVRIYQRKMSRVDVVVIDYAQLIQAEAGSARETRQQQLGRTTRRLKQMAKDLDVLVLVAAQVNRDSAKTGRAPRLYDLREAGDLENDADVVILCHLPGTEDSTRRAERNDFPEDGMLIVAKQRNGPIADSKVHFRRSCARWEDKADNEATVWEYPDFPSHWTEREEDNEYGPTF